MSECACLVVPHGIRLAGDCFPQQKTVGTVASDQKKRLFPYPLQAHHIASSDTIRLSPRHRPETYHIHLTTSVPFGCFGGIQKGSVVSREGSCMQVGPLLHSLGFLCLSQGKDKGTPSPPFAMAPEGFLKEHPSLCVLSALLAGEARDRTMEKWKFLPTCVHESPGLGASELSFLPGCAQRGLHENGAHCLANRLRRRAMTSHFSQPKWAGHPPVSLFIFEALYLSCLGLGSAEVSQPLRCF